MYPHTHAKKMKSRFRSRANSRGPLKSNRNTEGVTPINSYRRRSPAKNDIPKPQQHPLVVLAHDTTEKPHEYDTEIIKILGEM